MAFTFTRKPVTESLSTLVLIGASLLLFHAPAVQALWSDAVTSAPEWILVAVIPYLLHQVVYWGMVGFFGYVDRHNKPAFIARYRIQSGKSKRPPRSRVWRNILFTQTVLSPMMMLWLWGMLRLRGWTATDHMPGLFETLLQLAGLSVCAVIWFYTSHRFLHRPWWMKRVHRVHHEFRTTTAVASIYAHPAEFVFANFLTLGLGVILIAPTLPVLYLWTILSVHTVVAHHSGYAVPWMSWSVHHDWHHYRYKECFGTIGLLDTLFGTEKEFATFEHGETR